ncbi:putative leader peptide [Streptomyces mutabilis]|uniref:putative leader peptide n=1 Tax=Streptomyces mutabilis TaxID=67332 RepID=UPI00365E72CF
MGIRRGRRSRWRRGRCCCCGWRAERSFRLRELGGDLLDRLIVRLAASGGIRSPAARRRTGVALVVRRHVDLCRQSSAVCR